MRPEKIIDFHVHAFPDKVAPRAVAALKETYGVAPRTDGTVGALLAYMQQAGVDISVVLPVATKAAQVASINDWAAEAGTYRIVAFGALHQEMEDPAQEVERIIAKGIKGIKLQPQWQGFEPDDEAIFPIYEAAAGRLIIVFHAGNEIAPVEEIKSTPKRLGRVHRAFPGLTMVAAHFGGYRMWEEVKEHLLGRENVYLDTSYCAPEDLPDAEALEIIRAHGARRILFASDFPFGDPMTDIARWGKIGLSEEELEDICWRNAARLLNLST